MDLDHVQDPIAVTETTTNLSVDSGCLERALSLPRDETVIDAGALTITFQEKKAQKKERQREKRKLSEKSDRDRSPIKPTNNTHAHTQHAPDLSLPKVYTPETPVPVVPSLEGATAQPKKQRYLTTQERYLQLKKIAADPRKLQALRIAIYSTGSISSTSSWSTILRYVDDQKTKITHSNLNKNQEQWLSTTSLEPTSEDVLYILKNCLTKTDFVSIHGNMTPSDLKKIKDGEMPPSPPLKRQASSIVFKTFTLSDSVS